MPNFTESQLEKLFSELLEEKGYKHYLGSALKRQRDEVIIEEDLKNYLTSKYKKQNLTSNEINEILAFLKSLSSTTLYESNKKFFKVVSDGYLLKREERDQKDLLIDFLNEEYNIYKFVTQLEVEENELRIPDGVLYINGLPFVVFEFKSAIKEEVTIYDAYLQLTNRYKRDIPKLFVYNAFCVISDGANSKMGTVFALYEFFYGWHRVDKKKDEDNTIFTMINGLFEKSRLLSVIKDFIYFPDTSKKEEKIVCRYPQFYAVEALIDSIKKAKKPKGDGKGGTYFGATGSGKSYAMLYLTRELIRSKEFENPTIVLITDRVDLDEQLSTTFTNAKQFIGEDDITSVESRDDLRELLKGKKSGGVYLTTIQKFSEDFNLLSDRTNIICISDEAHRSQINLDMKVRVSEKGVKKSYGFAKYLHDSLPNAVYVGFSGTPIYATIDVFGEIVDSYTMKEAVLDEITVKIVYEGRATKVMLENSKLKEIEEYYEELESLGANKYQIEKSKKVIASMTTILGDSDRLKALAWDFINHYEKRVDEGASSGKAMFVCANREIAYKFYKEVIALRPQWAVKKANGKEKKAIEFIKLIMTRNKDDEKELYDMLGEDRKTNERAFKDEESNFKIAIVVDMWLTGFDVPSLDTIYIDKPIQQHSLIQTISRVNRKHKGKEKGLVVDYIGIKRQLNLALAKYNQNETTALEDIQSSVIVVKNHLELLEKFFYGFDSSGYFKNSPSAQFSTLQEAVEFVQKTKEDEKRFISLVKRLKSAYDICVGSEELNESDRERIHFYIAIRTYLFKLTKPNVPDTATINKKVAQMCEDAIKSSGVEEVFTLSEDKEIDLFDESYLEKLSKIKLPNTKIKLLQKLLGRAIDSIKKVNRVKGIEFSKKMKQLVEVYNERKEQDILKSEVYEDMAEQLTQMIYDIQKEFSSGEEIGIDFEEKAFYDILKSLCKKYDFSYPEDKLVNLSKAVKELVDMQAKFPDWDKREDIKATLKVELILLLDEHEYPPVKRDEVYHEIFEQAENYKKNSKNL